MKKYRKFKSIEDANNWGKTHYSYWLPRHHSGGKLQGCFEEKNIEHLFPKATEFELREIKKEMLEYKCFLSYCGGERGLVINERLRHGYTRAAHVHAEEQLKEMQEVMDCRLKSSFIPENIWGYRYLNYKDLRKNQKMRFVFPTCVIEDKGYMGVGLVRKALYESVGEYDTLLKIMIPKGSNGLYLNLISMRDNEQEVLLARGSRLKVIYCYMIGKKRVIVCKLL